MKHLKQTLKALLLVVLTAGFTSCSDDDDNGNIIEQDTTIAGLVSGSTNFEILLAAATRADLVTTLSTVSDTRLTVFAPNDAAFVAYLDVDTEADAIATINALPVATVRNLLLNHVLPTAVTASEVTTGYVKSLAENSTEDNLDLYIAVSNNVVTINGDAEVIEPNVVADNGIIHVVDAVIPEATIATFATADSNFSTLLAAVAQEELAATLAGTGSFTVFAPTNAAFVALINADPNDGISSAADILALGNAGTSTTSVLDNILRHHVLGTAVRAEALSTTGATPATPLFAGGGLSIDATVTPPTITDGSGTTHDIIATNITATNGVVHAIDGVLMPE
ncbi:fasciclin domain-containing protein [Leeuwenhoekiella parthenopeia]|uniref:Fasciclin domain-containing protein n=1 Tax=Leeuwenhoekiella parthenopeia TaxID=2890320 RepID=A0ABS8GWS8_9FLAO|nr:fasciclin domain-containing protein [Leeuwenhoekiella parthenopeia]MCC4214472.1 fasciclin domain-containing protein [Leeuwenhoekiella parthenopeia]